MARRQRQTTCFGSNIGGLFNRIERRAKNHNAHIVTKRPDLRELLEWIVPAEDRFFCQEVWRNFGDDTDSATRAADVQLAPEVERDGAVFKMNATLKFSWRNDLCESNDACFALPERLREATFQEDTPLEFLNMLAEWQINAMDWGLVGQVVNWIDDMVKPNDYASACYMLPMLPVLVSGMSISAAVCAVANRSPKNPPLIPAEFLPGIQRANQILAGSELIGDVEVDLKSPVSMWMSTGQSKHPLWPYEYDPEETAKY